MDLTHQNQARIHCLEALERDFRKLRYSKGLPEKNVFQQNSFDINGYLYDEEDARNAIYSADDKWKCIHAFRDIDVTTRDYPIAEGTLNKIEIMSDSQDFNEENLSFCDKNHCLWIAVILSLTIIYVFILRPIIGLVLKLGWETLVSMYSYILNCIGFTGDCVRNGTCPPACNGSVSEDSPS